MDTKGGNKEVNRLSKQVDYDDWFIANDLVKMLTNKWGKVSIDLLLIPIRKIKCLILNTYVQALRV